MVGCTLLLAAPWPAEAQVSRGGARQAAPAARPATPAQRPAAHPARQGNIQGNTRVGAGSNVAIGNDITVVRPPAGGAPGYRPPAYRPPVAVPVYPGYPSYSGPDAGDLLAVGIVAGAAAGLVSGAMQQPSTATVVTAQPAAPTETDLTIGTQLAAWPSGCTTQAVGSVTYFRCGTA
jgi:hypothetical protein